MSNAWFGVRAAVVVIGGGYAGVMAANRLTQRDDVTVTLINPRPQFVERVRLHQMIGGSNDAVMDFQEVLARDVRLVVDTVTKIRPAERSVTCENGAPFDYDYLIYAVGSRSTDLGVPGAAEFAYPAASLEEAQRLRSILDDTPASALVTVVGGGPLGIETAAELAELGRCVTLVCGHQLGPYLHPRARRTVAKELSRLGVNVLDGPGAEVTAVARDAVHLRDGRELPSTVTVWTTGFGVPDLAARSGLTTDALAPAGTDDAQSACRSRTISGSKSQLALACDRHEQTSGHTDVRFGSEADYGVGDPRAHAAACDVPKRSAGNGQHPSSCGSNHFRRACRSASCWSIANKHARQLLAMMARNESYDADAWAKHPMTQRPRSTRFAMC